MRKRLWQISPKGRGHWRVDAGRRSVAECLATGWSAILKFYVHHKQCRDRQKRGSRDEVDIDNIGQREFLFPCRNVLQQLLREFSGLAIVDGLGRRQRTIGSVWNCKQGSASESG